MAVLNGNLDNAFKMAEWGREKARRLLIFSVVTVGTPETVKVVNRAFPGHLNSRNAHGWETLHQAVNFGKLEMNQTLVQLGFSLEIGDSDGRSALHMTLWSDVMILPK